MSDKTKEREAMGEIITIAIAREKASIKFYTDALNKARSETYRTIFSLLIEQEKAHEAKLRALLYEIQSEFDKERALKMVKPKK